MFLLVLLVGLLVGLLAGLLVVWLVGWGFQPGWGLVWVGWQDEVELGSELAGLVAAVVQGVAGQSLQGVDPCRGAGPGHTVDHGEFPDAEVDQGVVTPADQGQAVDVGQAPVAPVGDVVGFAPFGWGRAAGDHAAAVSGDQGPALGAG
jgi:hypothetical protein